MKTSLRKTNSYRGRHEGRGQTCGGIHREYGQVHTQSRSWEQRIQVWLGMLAQSPGMRMNLGHGVFFLLPSLHHKITHSSNTQSALNCSTSNKPTWPFFPPSKGWLLVSVDVHSYKRPSWALRLFLPQCGGATETCTLVSLALMLYVASEQVIHLPFSELQDPKRQELYLWMSIPQANIGFELN